MHFGDTGANACALEAETGQPLWVHQVDEHPLARLTGSPDGALRAYSTTDGAIVWTFAANRAFPTVNGVPARGGSMIGPGPVVADGMVYLSAGYGAFGGRPGNVLLAFGLD